MSGRSSRGKFEARAKAFAAERIVPPEKQQLIDTILKNSGLAPEEKYQTVLNLVRACPLRTVPPKIRDKNAVEKHPSVNVPTEKNILKDEFSSRYVNHLYRKYRPLKLFKKKYLVHSDNRLGFALRKRLIPSRRFIIALSDIAGFQDKLVNRMHEISMMILDDPDIEDPSIFNYLRLIRTWLMSIPLVRLDYDVIKWMERQGFEREIRPYAKEYYSFLKLDAETRENIILQIEYALRKCNDLVKEIPVDGEDDRDRRNREKRNLLREEEIYRLILIVRSFLHGKEEEDSMISRHLNEKYGIESFPAFIRIMTEALVLQRPLEHDDLFILYRPATPRVSRDTWDYSKEYLKKIGKDPISLKERQIKNLQADLAPFNRIKEFLEYGGGPGSFLHKAATQQWRMIDKNRYDPEEMCQRNFIVYIECLVRFYVHCFLPFINGSPLLLKSPDGREWESMIFDRLCFGDRAESSMNILRELHTFRTTFPTLTLSALDVKKIIRRQIVTMNHAETILRSIGDFFYDVACELNKYYESHLKWESCTSYNPADPRLRYPIERKIDDQQVESFRPIPFFDCTIESFPQNNILNGLLRGVRILETQPEGGIIFNFIAFCYQVASICYSENLFFDIEKRKEILSKLRSLN